MVTERYFDPEVYEAVVKASRAAYRRAAELVADRIAPSLVAGAGQIISESEWSILTEEVSDAYGDAYLDALVQAGIEFKVLPGDSAVLDRLAIQDAAVADLASTIRDLLDSFLGDMVEQGVSALEIQDRLLDAAASPLNSRKADMFARTATNTAINSGFEASFRAAGVPFVSWITRRDDRVRETHAEVDRDIIPTGTMFDVGGYEAAYPGDPSLPIGLRINCRCMLGWVDGGEVKRAVSSTRKDLYRTARELNIPNRSKMRKPELQLAIVEELCLQGLAAGPDCPDRLDDMNVATLLTYGRVGNIRGRYRMRRPALLDAVRERFRGVEGPTWLGFASSVEAVPMTVSRITALADAVINNEPVTVAPEDAADLIEILGRHTEPVDLTLVRATPELFTKVADNPLSRDEMPQIPENWIEDFQSFLEENGVTVELRVVDPLDVFATQNQLDGRKVGKMITAIRNDQFEPDTPAFVSADGYILDGHHRWAALAALSLEGADETMVSAATSVRIDGLLDLAAEFADLHNLESKSHGMAWRPSQARHPRGISSGGRWRSEGRSSFHPTSRPSIFDPEHAKAWHEDRDRVRTYERERRIENPPDRAQMERHRDQFGKGVDAVLPGDGPAKVPFEQATRTPGEPLYDRQVVADLLAQDVRLQNFDARTLSASQTGVSREAVDYYTNDPAYTATGRTYADQGEAGNRYPVIYRNPTTKELVILSGHARATAALAAGRPVQGILVDPRIRVIRARTMTEDDPD